MNLYFFVNFHVIFSFRELNICYLILENCEKISLCFLEILYRSKIAADYFWRVFKMKNFNKIE